MQSGWDLVLIGIVLIGYAVVSQRLAGTMITGPIVFVSAGLLLGNELLGIFDAAVTSADIRLVAEVTLALLLFTDASALDSRRLLRQTTVPIRLLAVALPLAIVAGTLVGLPLFSELGLFEVVMLAVLLAPTDAALGQTVVSDHRVPAPIRQGLNVESGLNDGVCVPILVAAVAFAELEERPTFDGQVLIDLVKEVSIAVVVGALVAASVAFLVRAVEERGWVGEAWSKIIPLATVAVAYATTAELHGSGFIAAFVAGLVYGRLLGDQVRRLVTLDEQLGQLLSSITFLLFGAVMVGPALRALSVEVVVYALLSLTVVRMVPVAVSMVGTGATRPTVAFMGWFGPRGLATIVFTLTIVEESGLPGTRLVSNVAIVTVFFSVIAHGVTAPILTDRYTDWIARHRDPVAHGLDEATVDVATEVPR